MFRKLYKEANDNIKVDEALLEKTLETAFSAQIPKKRKYNFTAISSVAAAVVVAIGCSAAYPALVQKPAVENEATGIVNQVEPQQISEALIQVAYPEETASATQKPAKRVSKPVKTAPVEVPVAPEEPAPAGMPAAVEQEAVPLSRMGGEEVAAVEPQHKLPIPEIYEQVSCVYNEDGSESYVFEGEDEKVISVVITPGQEESMPVWTETQGEIGLTFHKDTTTVDVAARNMTRDEVEEIFKDYIPN